MTFSNAMDNSSFEFKPLYRYFDLNNYIDYLRRKNTPVRTRWQLANTVGPVLVFQGPPPPPSKKKKNSSARVSWDTLFFTAMAQWDRYDSDGI